MPRWLGKALFVRARLEYKSAVWHSGCDSTGVRGCYFLVVERRAMIRLEDVWYEYPGSRGSWALRGITLRVNPGERLVLLGANGSGKTTLLHLCNGLLRPQRGVLYWGEQKMDYSQSGLRHLRLRVATVLQNPEHQLFAGCAEDDVGFGPRNAGWDEDTTRRAVREALAAVGMEEFAQAPLETLSYGRKKRVALAGALAMRPEVLLLDEPTAGLDPRSEGELLRVLDESCRNGTAVVMATHDVELALWWADRIVILLNGVLVWEGCGVELRADRRLLGMCALIRDRRMVADEMTERKVLARILVYTGDGKGKTTAAMGLAMRGIGRGLRVAICQFIKRQESGEILALKNFSQVRWMQCGRGFLPREDSETWSAHLRAALRGWRWSRAMLRSENVDMVILDEICLALRRGLLPMADVLGEIRKARHTKTIVCTGRHAPQQLLDLADTVTEMNCVRHGLSFGILAQYGVEL